MGLCRRSFIDGKRMSCMRGRREKKSRRASKGQGEGT
jgi:hypothetical protein